MLVIILYSFLLLGGVVVSQTINLTAINSLLETITIILLSYIMIEVGLEFTLNKRNLKSYAWDYLVAATAAAIPWFFCVGYFTLFLRMDLLEASLLGRFAAPTSAGVLFAMLAAAGLGSTWLFRKARILAIFDDLDTVLLLVPLQIMLIGFNPRLMSVVIIMLGLLSAAYRWLHLLRMPIGKLWLLGYGILIVFLCQYLEHTTHVELEILLPAFVLGCILYDPRDFNQHAGHEHTPISVHPEGDGFFWFDHLMKGGFMFLVGCSLPKITIGDASIGFVALHVIVVTLLINIGKCFPSLCYRKEASVKQRMALSVAMFPRGEVGAGVLLIAMGHGITGLSVTVAVLSLALNLLLTGAFISAVLWLVKADPAIPGHHI